MLGEDFWTDPRPINLTDRERDIVEAFMLDGAPNIEIGKKLYLSEKTVKFHLSNVMKKLGATNRTHLALIICRQERER